MTKKGLVGSIGLKCQQCCETSHVDLDPQAVEIARLNLLLRGLARRDPLPSLKDNLKRGNSLISGGEQELRPYFGERWREKRPFNWEQEFSQIMGDGGFDVVIGNPPYIRIQSLPREDADYYRDHYVSAHGSFDIYVMFIEQGLKLLKPGGRLGFITSGKFLKSAYGEKLQEHLVAHASVEKIVDLSSLQVFGDATTYPVIVVLKKGSDNRPLTTYIGIHGQGPFSAPEIEKSPAITVEHSSIKKGVWPPPSGDAKTLKGKVDSISEHLGELSANVFTGLQTSADKVYILEDRGPLVSGKRKVYSRALNKEFELE